MCGYSGIRAFQPQVSYYTVYSEQLYCTVVVYIHLGHLYLIQLFVWAVVCTAINLHTHIYIYVIIYSRNVQLSHIQVVLGEWVDGLIWLQLVCKHV